MKLRLFAAAAVLSGCAVDVGSFSGKTCDVAADCPAPYVCVATAPGVDSCELLALPTTADAGEVQDAGPALPINYALDIQPIWNASCGGGGCHSGGFLGGQLDLGTADVSYAQLVGAASSEGCDPLVKRVVPGDLAGSMLWRKIADDPTKCNTAMPTTGGLKAISPAKFRLVERWILEGAKKEAP